MHRRGASNEYRWNEKNVVNSDSNQSGMLCPRSKRVDKHFLIPTSADADSCRIKFRPSKKKESSHSIPVLTRPALAAVTVGGARAVDYQLRSTTTETTKWSMTGCARVRRYPSLFFLLGGTTGAMQPLLDTTPPSTLPLLFGFQLIRADLNTRK